MPIPSLPPFASTSWMTSCAPTYQMSFSPQVGSSGVACLTVVSPVSRVACLTVVSPVSSTCGCLAQRSDLTHSILNNIKYGKKASQKGLAKLVANGSFVGAYPLHDGDWDVSEACSLLCRVHDSALPCSRRC